MSVWGGIKQFVGYHSPAERSAQMAARARLVAQHPDMAGLSETRVAWSFGLRACRDVGMACGWMLVGYVMFCMISEDQPRWAAMLACIGTLLAIPMAAGNALTGLINLLRACFSRFDWIAFEELHAQGTDSPIPGLSGTSP